MSEKQNKFQDKLSVVTNAYPKGRETYLTEKSMATYENEDLQKVDEPTLKQIGKFAANNFKLHSAAAAEGDAFDRLDQKMKNTQEQPKGHPNDWTGKEFTAFVGNNARERQTSTEADAKQHFEDHTAEYHDAAVIDAHLDGVKVNVQQPLEIGQKVEVHTPDQSTSGVSLAAEEEGHRGRYGLEE